MVVPLAMGLSKRHKFSIITIENDTDEDETPPPFIAIYLGHERLESNAFIDFGATPSRMSCSKH